MGRAFACDRCGDLFKNEDHEDKIPVVLEGGMPFSLGLEYANIYISLCPKCRAGFQKWWDTDAVHKTTDPDCPPMVETLYKVDNEDEYDVATRIANMNTTSEVDTDIKDKED